MTSPDDNNDEPAGDREDRPFFSLGFRFGGLLDVIAMLALASTWIGFLGGLLWFFDLFDHFRLQYLAVCLVAVVWFACQRRWWVLAVALVSLGANAWPVARTTWVAAPDEPLSRWALKVVCFNVLTSNERKDEVVEYFRKSDADVIIALEVNTAWARALKKLEPSYPHLLVNTREDNFGIAVFSRVAWRDARFRTFAEEKVLSFTATLTHAGHELLLVATHPVPPMNRDHSRNALAQLAAIGTFVADQRVAALVVGDLNAAPWSRAIKALKRGAPLDFRAPGPAWKPTWMATTPLMLPLDHALCTPPLVIERRTIGADLGSDHRAQLLVLRWQGQG